MNADNPKIMRLGNPDAIGLRMLHRAIRVTKLPQRSESLLSRVMRAKRRLLWVEMQPVLGSVPLTEAGCKWQPVLCCALDNAKTLRRRTQVLTPADLAKGTDGQPKAKGATLAHLKEYPIHSVKSVGPAGERDLVILFARGDGEDVLRLQLADAAIRDEVMQDLQYWSTRSEASSIFSTF